MFGNMMGGSGAPDIKFLSQSSAAYGTGHTASFTNLSLGQPHPTRRIFGMMLHDSSQSTPDDVMSGTINGISVEHHAHGEVRGGRGVDIFSALVPAGNTANVSLTSSDTTGGLGAATFAWWASYYLINSTPTDTQGVGSQTTTSSDSITLTTPVKGILLVGEAMNSSQSSGSISANFGTVDVKQLTGSGSSGWCIALHATGLTTATQTVTITHNSTLGYGIAGLTWR
jgi:hypothetical protein